MPTVGGQQDLPGGGHRGLPAVGHVLTLRNRPGEATARQRRHPPAHRGRVTELICAHSGTLPGARIAGCVAGPRCLLAIVVFTCGEASVAGRVLTVAGHDVVSAWFWDHDGRCGPRT